MQKYWKVTINNETFYVMVSVPYHAVKGYYEAGCENCVVTNYPSSGTGSHLYSRNPTPYPETMFQPMPFHYSLFPYWGKKAL